MIDEDDNLIGLFYDSATDEPLWNLALEEIANLASAAREGTDMPVGT